MVSGWNFTRNPKTGRFPCPIPSSSIGAITPKTWRGSDPSAAFATICATLAGAAAELDIQSIEDAGELAGLAFSRIADGQSRGLFGADTLAAFSKTIGRDITANDVTPAIDKLVAANLIVRKGHGIFEVADPFVKRAWQQRATMREALGEIEGEAGSERG